MIWDAVFQKASVMPSRQLNVASMSIGMNVEILVLKSFAARQTKNVVYSVLQYVKENANVMRDSIETKMETVSLEIYAVQMYFQILSALTTES